MFFNIVSFLQYDDGTIIGHCTTTHGSQEIKAVMTKQSDKEIFEPNLTEDNQCEIKKNADKKISQPEMSKVYFPSLVPLAVLSEGDKVMFVEKVGNRFALKTKDCVTKSKELIAYIRELDKSGK